MKKSETEEKKEEKRKRWRRRRRKEEKEEGEGKEQGEKEENQKRKRKRRRRRGRKREREKEREGEKRHATRTDAGNDGVEGVGVELVADARAPHASLVVVEQLRAAEPRVSRDVPGGPGGVVVSGGGRVSHRSGHDWGSSHD